MEDIHQRKAHLLDFLEPTDIDFSYLITERVHETFIQNKNYNSDSTCSTEVNSLYV